MDKDKEKKCDNCGLPIKDGESLCSFCKEYGSDARSLSEIRLFTTRHLSLLQERYISNS